MREDLKRARNKSGIIWIVIMKHVYIETFGCQMNKADTEHMLGLLDEIDYKYTEKIDDADLVLFNTCTIRETANHRFYSQLGIIGKMKRKGGVSPPLIAVGGCVAQDKRDWLRSNFPYVDIVLVQTMFTNSLSL